MYQTIKNLEILFVYVLNIITFSTVRKTVLKNSRNLFTDRLWYQTVLTGTPTKSEAKYRSSIKRINIEINMESTIFQDVSQQISSTMFQTLSEQIGLPQSLQSNLALAIEDNPWNLGLFKLLVQNPNG